MIYYLLKFSFSDLLSVIEPDDTSFRHYTLDEQTTREKQVRGIIIGRLDNHHHKMVLGMDNPSEMIKLLKQRRKDQSNLTSMTVRMRLRNRMKSREPVAEYIERFE